MIPIFSASVSGESAITLTGAVISDITGTTITVDATSSGDLSSAVYGVEYSVLDNGGNLSGYTFSKNTAGAVTNQTITIGAGDGVTADSTVTVRAYYNLDVLDPQGTRVYANDIVPVVVAGDVPSGTQTEGETLTQVQGIIAGSSPIAVTYQWQNDGGTGTWANIGGATSATYELQASDVGDDVAVVHTGTNSAGADSTRSAETGPIAASGDPYWANVTYLVINNNGADGTNTFTDESTSGLTTTAVGNAQWDDAQAPTGLSTTCVFDGTGDALTVADNAAFGFGTGDFTIECFIRSNGSLATDNIFDFRESAATDVAIDVYYTSLGGIIMETAGNTRITGANGSIVANTWQHIAISKSSGSTKLFVDGTQVGSTYADSNDYTASRPLRMGSGYTGSNAFTGWMASFRTTKGVARYTANFTPPELPLPNS